MSVRRNQSSNGGPNLLAVGFLFFMFIIVLVIMLALITGGPLGGLLAIFGLFGLAIAGTVIFIIFLPIEVLIIIAMYYFGTRKAE